MANTSTVASAASQITLQEKIIKGLIDTKELAYANNLISTYGFMTAGRWSTLEKNVENDLNLASKPNCNLKNLEQIVDRVISTADHSYQMVELHASQAINIRNALKKIDINKFPTMYSAFYPMKIEFAQGGSYPIGEHLCKVVDLGDGLACIITSVFKEKKKGIIGDIYVQEFHTVFIPHSHDRIEFRVSNKISPLKLAKTFSRIEEEFTNILGLSLPSDIFSPKKVYNAIVSLFSDKSEGRVQYAMMTTSEDGDDAELNGRTRKSYCARMVNVANSNNNHLYLCRSLRVRYSYASTNTLETELAITPHKRDWETTDCFQFSIKHPESPLVLSSMINKITSRS
jgi:hypothetical protein